MDKMTRIIANKLLNEHCHDGTGLSVMIEYDDAIKVIDEVISNQFNVSVKNQLVSDYKGRLQQHETICSNTDANSDDAIERGVHRQNSISALLIKEFLENLEKLCF